MAKKKKLFAGVGAKCTVLTKFVRPKLAGFADDHRTTCILKEMRTIRVNKKDQECFVFEENGVDYHAVKRYFKVIEEGDASGFFPPEEAAAQRRAKEAADAFKEPKVKWRKSKAKRILYELLMDGTIPLDDTMPFEEFFLLSQEFASYDPEKFKSRLRSLRDKISELDKRAEEDRKAFDVYKKNHEVSLFSHKGYIQWQGSDAQDLLWDDIEAGKLGTMTKKQLWESRPEYREEFPLFAFRKKVEQEIRTSKYVHTVRMKGILHKAS